MQLREEDLRPNDLTYHLSLSQKDIESIEATKPRYVIYRSYLTIFHQLEKYLLFFELDISQLIKIGYLPVGSHQIVMIPNRSDLDLHNELMISQSLIYMPEYYKVVNTDGL